MIKIGKEHHAYAFDKAETPVELERLKEIGLQL